MEQKQLTDAVEAVLKEEEKALKTYLSANEEVKKKIFNFLEKQVSKKPGGGANQELVKKTLEDALNKVQPTTSQQDLEESGTEKVYRYRCKTACTFGGRYRAEGDIIESPKELKVPHFVLVEEK